MAHAQRDSSYSDDDYFFLKAIAPAIPPATESELLDSTKKIIKDEKAKRQLEMKKKIENMSYDDLFMNAFKKEAFRAHYFMVRFYADGKSFGNTEISYDSAFTSFNFHSIPFSRYLDTILIANERSKINGSDGNFNSEILKKLGFEINLNEQSYELQINLPAEIKELQLLNFSKSKAPVGMLIKPAFFSFYANLRANESFACANDCLRDPLYMDLDGAATMFGWTLESSGRFREQRYKDITKDDFRRGNARIVHDIYSLNSRITLGDVGEFGGIRYEHSERIFTRNRITDKHKINFFLPRAAYVELHIDGKMNRRLFLPSGHHEISGFTGHTGVNEVKVFITQQDGSLKEVRYEFELGDARTLAKGESRYFINAGARRTSVRTIASYKYHPDELGLYGEYLYGLFHSTSLGYQWRYSEQNLVTGLKVMTANLLGYSELLGFINSADSSSQIGKRAELNHYINFDRPFKYFENINVSLSGYFQDSRFSSSLFTNQWRFNNSEFAGIWGSLGTSFSKSYLSINAGTYFNHKSQYQNFIDYHYGISASTSILGIYLSAGISSNISKYATRNSFYISTAYNFGVNRHRFRLNGGLNRISNTYNSQYTEDEEQQEYMEIPGYTDSDLRRNVGLGWNWSDGGTNSWGQAYSANVSSIDEFDNLNANLNAHYYFNRMEAGANYGYSYKNIFRNRQSHIVSANMATSFMFADGLWAFGRQVKGGFILADVDKSLAGATVRMNYSQSYNKDLSHSGWLGSAYQNRVSHYRPTSINIRLNNMPPGAWLEQNQYYVTGAYKQGYALKLGNDMRVFMQTRLRDERGALSNVYVAIFKIDQEGKIAEKRVTFTSKEGTLQMGNLIPGEKYRLTFDPSTYIKSVDIEIPSDSEPFMEMPYIKVERE